MQLAPGTTPATGTDRHPENLQKKHGASARHPLRATHPQDAFLHRERLPDQAHRIRLRPVLHRGNDSRNMPHSPEKMLASARRKIEVIDRYRRFERQRGKDEGVASERPHQSETPRHAPNFRCGWPVYTDLEAKRLKTLELQIKRTLDSQIESSEYAARCRLVKRRQNDTCVSI